MAVSLLDREKKSVRCLSFLHAQRYASVVYAIGLCLASQVRPTYFIETTECIQLIFSKEATLGLSDIVLEGNSGISENRGRAYFPLELCPKLLPDKSCHGTSTLASVVNLGYFELSMAIANKLNHTEHAPMCRPSTRWE